MAAIVNSPISALVSLALDAATMRQQALAQNIANAKTPGYQRMSVSFEQRLQSMLSQDGKVAATSLASLQPVLELDPPSENSLALDQEVAQLSENALHHQALLKVLSKHYAMLGLAINEGKR